MIHETLSQEKRVGLRRETQKQAPEECWCSDFLHLAGTMLGLHNIDPNTWAAPHSNRLGRATHHVRPGSPGLHKGEATAASHTVPSSGAVLCILTDAFSTAPWVTYNYEAHFTSEKIGSLVVLNNHHRALSQSDGRQSDFGRASQATAQ